MFVQVIQGQVSDVAGVRAQMDKWDEELAPGAIGWLGSTAGVTADGNLVALARFESEEAAQQNSDRPEQGAWWEQMSKLFSGEPEFHNSTTVDVDTYGDPAQAGFVQVMQGRSSNPERARELMMSDPTDWQAFRPDILGTVESGTRRRLDDGDLLHLRGGAREGEKKQPPPEMEAMMKEMER